MSATVDVERCCATCTRRASCAPLQVALAQVRTRAGRSTLWLSCCARWTDEPQPGPSAAAPATSRDEEPDRPGGGPWPVR